METNDFDQLIQSKVGESHAHEKELKETQPYLWTAIQNEAHTTQTNKKWWFLAAAAILLLFGLGSAFLWQMQQNHKRALSKLNNELQLLSNQKSLQAHDIKNKDAKLLRIQQSLVDLERKLQEQNQVSKQTAPIKHLVLRKDTVYIETIRYIEKENNLAETNPSNLSVVKLNKDSVTTDDEINKKIALFTKTPAKRTKDNSNNGVSLRLAQLSKP